MSSWRFLVGCFASGLATLLALPLLCHPALVEAWARWHRDAARLLLSGAKAEPPARERVGVARALLFLPANIVTGLAIGLFLLVVVGNFALAAVTTPFWWAFPAPDRPRLFTDVFVGDWATALTLGLLQLALLGTLAYLGFPIVARAQARLCVALLTPSREQRLAERVAELTRTRADVLDAHGAELRRIERDLHDGTQARLVAIAMHLDLARKSLPAETPPLVDRLLREAHDNSEEAMTELRDVIRGIHPPILTDRGLPGALAALTARCPIPTTLHLDDAERVPAAVESVIYYAVAEALTNIARHSRATEANVHIHRTATRLIARVTDNGTGGAHLPNRALVSDAGHNIAAPPGARGAARATAGRTAGRTAAPRDTAEAVAQAAGTAKAGAQEENVPRRKVQTGSAAQTEAQARNAPEGKAQTGSAAQTEAQARNAPEGKAQAADTAEDGALAEKAAGCKGQAESAAVTGPRAENVAQADGQAERPAACAARAGNEGAAMISGGRPAGTGLRAMTRARDRAWAWAGDAAASRAGGAARSGTGETAGTGLAGIRDRVAALDGRLTVDSPVGGPTTIALEVPCG